jgi:chromosome segregation ATPase|uniref:Uncharacterized protein n=1 Tax=Haptolina ericina TaxID=156174 RepID=A0A7S3ERC0_9EUKA|mmetsp:Transcript_10803/g.24888  ORF Transcript_10803/g.24888 Transcript_10803/m.24888 type:complete len:194 (+) Transcript_10803:115-696(+)|eukprot:CAMPEP_0181225546 /NCGR_PEP_ID=MMETSP1096-20121128/31761_1 /TAXON_ID=156174 ORGANISM="Chrysochromulina ericina, Strain CCMP281" /NCGR_SAMPLE_ID=MMETSP1096 /ASSEMBLY_ACC=CAM_ASM_000453 /LENGTH=193 /DNA_ID=CAMNT_0023318789 /DNA_START=272 /DNA_END=853 /DNA_ORIENTATION=-
MYIDGAADACRVPNSQAATASLQALTSKLVKSRHSMHATNLQCEATRTECEKARREVEANDTEIAALEEQERKLKLLYVESKLAYEKVHALKHQQQGDLRQARVQKVATNKTLESLGGALRARQGEWTKAREQHSSREAHAAALAAKLEAVEKDKESHRRRAVQHREEVLRYTEMHEALKRELEVINASAESV